MFRRPARKNSRRPILEALECRQLLTGYMVTSAADSGAGTLRAAITSADSDGQVGADTIFFDIPGGGVQTIALLSPLPAITRTAVIDATMQPGYMPGGAPQVAIDGSDVEVGADGLWFDGGAGGSEVRGLAIGNFSPGATGGGGRGILVQDAGKDLFQGDYLGIAADGVTATPNAFGIELDAPGNTVGGTIPGGPDLISGNLVDGILTAGSNASGNIIQGNRIGTDSSGIYSVGNLDGVDLASPGNLVGGTQPGQSNLISGNVGPAAQTGIGILLQGDAPGNLIEGNQIGVNSTGNAADPDVYGIYFGSPNPANAKNDTVMEETIYHNQIAGNFIGITGNATVVLIAGNTIGLNGPGTAAIPNGYGLLLGASASTIGGTLAISPNIISGNGSTGTPGTGLDLTGDSDLVQGNRVGLNLAGTAAVPNVIGMNLHLTNSTVGGTTPAAANFVSGNSGDGIRLDTNGPVALQGNVLSANGGDGVDILLPAPATPATTPLILGDTIGGTTYGSGNYILDNAGSGIAVDNTYGPGVNGLAFRSNAISGNGRLGIDLTSTGVALPGYLVITYATPPSSGKITVTGIFHGTPGVGYPVDFFANTTADASGSGQGQLFLGSAIVTPGPGGIASFVQTLNAPGFAGAILSATYTDEFGNTSEFSANYPAATPPVATDLVLTASPDSSSVTVNGVAVFTETVTNIGAATAQGVVLNDALPVSLVNAFASTTTGNVSIAPTTNILTANLGSLAPGQSATVTIAANPSASTTLSNTAGVSSTTFDSDYANNLATQTLIVNPAVAPSADLSVSEVASSATPAVGANLTYTVTVTNFGPSAATNVKLNDFLPTTATLIGYFPSQGSVINGNYLATTFGTIASGSTAVLTIVIRPTVAGKIINAANVSGAQPDPIGSNNSTSLSLTAS